MTVDQLIAKLQAIRNTHDSKGVTKGDYEIFIRPGKENIDTHLVVYDDDYPNVTIVCQYGMTE